MPSSLSAGYEGSHPFLIAVSPPVDILVLSSPEQRGSMTEESLMARSSIFSALQPARMASSADSNSNSGGGRRRRRRRRRNRSNSNSRSNSN